MRFVTLIFFMSICHLLHAQADTEFPKEFIMHGKLQSGMVTDFGNAADQYTGGIQITAQYTIAEHKLRGGLAAEGYYTGKKIQAAIGPTVSLKLKTFKLGLFGTGGNLHLSLDHLWGSMHTRLLGGGLNADIGNLLIAGITAHRDYEHNTWWFRTSLGIRISKVRKNPAL